MLNLKNLNKNGQSANCVPGPGITLKTKRASIPKSQELVKKFRTKKNLNLISFGKIGLGKKSLGTEKKWGIMIKKLEAPKISSNGIILARAVKKTLPRAIDAVQSKKGPILVFFKDEEGLQKGSHNKANSHWERGFLRKILQKKAKVRYCRRADNIPTSRNKRGTRKRYLFSFRIQV